MSSTRREGVIHAYEFKPTPEMRTFGETVAHTISSQLASCLSISGKPLAAPTPKDVAAMTTKDALTKAAADTFAFCDDYFSNLKHTSQLEEQATVPSTRNGQPIIYKVPMGSWITAIIEHNNEEYGYLSVYLRLKGLVPPSSDRAAAK